MRALFFAFSFLLSSACAPVLPLGGNALLPTLQGIFDTSGATFQDALVTAWGTRRMPALRPLQDLALARRLERTLGLSGRIKLTRRSTYARAVATGSGTTITVETVTIGPQVSEMVYSVDRALGAFPTEEDIGRLTTPLTALGLTPQLAVNVVGRLPGRDWGRRLHILSTLLAGRAAREADGVTSGPYVSVTADAGNGGPTVLVAGKPVNVQVALTYDTSTASTEVTVGSPLISITY